MDVIQLGGPKIEGLEEIKLNLDPIDLNMSSSPSNSSNLPGVELLMNHKKKEAPPSIQISDLDNLENELNSLSQVNTPKISFETPAMEFPRVDMSSMDVGKSVQFDDKPIKVDKSWDGFKSINAVDPDKLPNKENAADTLREKFKFLRKLEDIEQKGGRLTRKYTMDSSLDEMKGEYENIISEKEKSNSVKFQVRC